MKSRLVYRWGFAVLGVSAAVNLIVAVRVFFAMQSPVAYNIRVIEPPVFTNIVSQISLPPIPGMPSTNEVSRAVEVKSDLITNFFEVASEQYHYMRVDDFPSFRLNGRNYSVGDVTAYGTVERIFPERVYLAGGGYISNSRRVFDVAEFVPPRPVLPSDSSLAVKPGSDSSLAVKPGSDSSLAVKPREEIPHDSS